jgi:transcriptional regulator of acetoin/glycerol metabolism
LKYSDMPARSLGARLKTGDTGAIRYVRSVLKAHGWNISHAAEALSVSRVALHGWLASPGLEKLRKEIEEKRA